MWIDYDNYKTPRTLKQSNDRKMIRKDSYHSMREAGLGSFDIEKKKGRKWLVVIAIIQVLLVIFVYTLQD
jgi:hypothetical protein